MVSSYVNDLRLEEIANGEASGTWGTKTNANLELIGEALGFGTRAIADASTDNITIADGASDNDRALYLVLTGGGQVCTITLLPNTSSKVWIMKNSTSFALTFTQGSGANVAIAAGQTKVIATNGGGSGGIVYELGSLEVNGDLTAAGTVKALGDTAANDLAALGYTDVLGAIITGQGSTNDVTIVNDADATVAGVPTGTTNVNFAGNVILSEASSVNISTPLLATTDETFTGLSAEMLAGGAIAAFDLVCIHTTTSEVVEADASAYATARVIGIAPAAISDTATGTVLLQGFVRDDTWAWTTGSTLYLSETAGAMTHTAPTTDGAFVNVVGVALSPDVVYINPSMDVIEHA